MFKNYIKIGDLLVRVNNTCGFDSILSILTIALIDSAKYFEHIKKSNILTCELILCLAEIGAKNEVYLRRAKILLNFGAPVAQSNQNEALIKNS